LSPERIGDGKKGRGSNIKEGFGDGRNGRETAIWESRRNKKETADLLRSYEVRNEAITRRSVEKGPESFEDWRLERRLLKTSSEDGDSST